MLRAPMGRFLSEFIYFYCLFFPVVPFNSRAFLSCRYFDVNATFLTDLVECWSFFCLLAWAVDSWSSNHWLFKLLGFEISFFTWPGLLISEFKSLMRGEVRTLGHFVLWWHHWGGIWRRLILLFWSLQVCLFSYRYFQGVLWTWFLLLFSFLVLP